MANSSDSEVSNDLLPFPDTDGAGPESTGGNSEPPSSGGGSDISETNNWSGKISDLGKKQEEVLGSSQKVLNELKAEMTGYKNKQLEIQTRRDQYQEQTKKDLAEQQSKIRAIEAPPLPKVDPRETRASAIPLLLYALVAGRTSAYPALSAMTNLTAVIEGFKKGDIDEMESKMKLYTADIAKTKESYLEGQADYNRILNNDKLNFEETQNELKNVARQQGDDLALANLELVHFDKVLSSIEHQRKSYEAMMGAHERALQSYEMKLLKLQMQRELADKRNKTLLEVGDRRNKSLIARIENQMVSVVDKQDHNNTKFVTKKELRDHPERYIITNTTGINKYMTAHTSYKEFKRAANELSSSINNLEKDNPKFSQNIRAELAAVMSISDDSGVKAYLKGTVTKEMSLHEQKFVVNLKSMIENAMTMRNMLNMGVGAIDIRDAIRATLPSPMSADYRMMRLSMEQVNQTVDTLNQFIPLNIQNMQPSDNQTGSEGTVTVRGEIFTFVGQNQKGEFVYKNKVGKPFISKTKIH
jgi:chromosome segregation ATPase